MKTGLAILNFDPRSVAHLARLAEEHGWDGVFLGDAIWTIDPMISLTAAAMLTSRIRLGTMVIPVPLRRPWKIASESIALDLCSGGRLILSLGTGATWMGWQGFPDEPLDLKTRVEMLDECIDILTLLFRRKQFDYTGKHYHLKLTQVDEMHYPPVPVQQPRIPLWTVGVWPRPKSIQRTLKGDGILPNKLNPQGKFDALQPEDVAQIRDFVRAHRDSSKPFDIVVEGNTSNFEPAKVVDTVTPWCEAGATWWIEGLWAAERETVEARIRQGPPRLENR